MLGKGVSQCLESGRFGNVSAELPLHKQLFHRNFFNLFGIAAAWRIDVKRF